MLRSVAFFVVAWLYQLLVLPALPVLVWMSRRGRVRRVRAIAGAIAGHWSRTLVAVAGARLTVRGRVEVPPDQPVLFVSNHQGAFDIGIIAGYVGRPVGFVSKAEIGRIPSIGTWMKLIGCIFLNRSDPRQGAVVVDRAAEALRRGDSLVIFPEGTRSNGPTMRRFKTGAARIAIQAGVPLIPLTMKDTHRMRRGDDWSIRPADVEMVVGSPIPTAGLTDQDVQALTDRLQDVIQRGLEPCDRGVESMCAGSVPVG